MWSYAGLTGGLSAPGQSSADLSIIKAGNRRLRTELVELALRLLLHKSGDDGHTVGKTFVRKMQGGLRGGRIQQIALRSID